MEISSDIFPAQTRLHEIDGNNNVFSSIGRRSFIFFFFFFLIRLNPLPPSLSLSLSFRKKDGNGERGQTTARGTALETTDLTYLW